MSRASDAANGLMVAVVQVCGLFDVPLFRLQSRVFTVAGKGGRQRPMFTGEWTDDQGVKHHAGMTDFLLMPRIRLDLYLSRKTLSCVTTAPILASLPLWVEAKMGTGHLTGDQKLFRDYVVAHGMDYLQLHNSAEDLVTWFKLNGVSK